MTTHVEKPPAVQFVGGFIVTALMFPLIILGAGGNWQWVEGWLFALWFDVMVLANMTYLYFTDATVCSPGPDSGFAGTRWSPAGVTASCGIRSTWDACS